MVWGHQSIPVASYYIYTSRTRYTRPALVICKVNDRTYAHDPWSIPCLPRLTARYVTGSCSQKGVIPEQKSMINRTSFMADRKGYIRWIAASGLGAAPARPGSILSFYVTLPTTHIHTKMWLWTPYGFILVLYFFRARPRVGVQTTVR